MIKKTRLLSQTRQVIKKVPLDFFDNLPAKLQNLNFVFLFCNFGRCGGLLNAKGNPDGSLSHYSSLRNFRLDGFFDSLTRLLPQTRFLRHIQPLDLRSLIVVQQNFFKALPCLCQRIGTVLAQSHTVAVAAGRDSHAILRSGERHDR